MKWIALFLLLTKCAGAQNVTAFVNVTLVPMNRPVLLKHQTVFVSGDRITRIVPARLASVPANVQSIDGRGKFLMPGLADMHAHFIREALPEAAVQKPAASHGPELPASASADHERENRAFGMLFLANGVTTVRNLWGSPTIDAFSAEIRSGTAAGPFIYSTGPITDGNPPMWYSTRAIETREQAEEAVATDKRDGRVAIKVYSQLSSDAYAAIVAAAKKEGLPVVGHVPRSVGVDGVIAAHQVSIEHLDGIMRSLQRPGPPKETLSEFLKNVDTSQLPAMAHRLSEAKIWVCPTIAVSVVPRTDPAWLQQAAFVPPALFTRYALMYPENRLGTARADDQAIQDLSLIITSALHTAGVPLLLGTDAMKGGTLPGYALHDELSHFVSAGMSPYEALRAGTADAAKSLGASSEFGTITAGSRADLLLLEANPLNDVKNAAKIDGVMAAGRWYPVAELQKALIALKATYNSPPSP